MIYNEEYYKEGDAYEKRLGRLAKATNSILAYNAKSVLDVGCGQGYLVKLLNKRGVVTTGMDISPDAGKKCPNNFVQHDSTDIPWDFKDNEFDAVISLDFFEHLPESEVQNVYREMKRVAPVVIAWICYKHEKRKNTPDSHLTVKPKAWWLEKLPGIILL